MQNTLRLGIVLLFLVITIKSQASLPPSTQPIWPTAEVLTPHRMSLKLEEVKQLTFPQFQRKLKKVQTNFPRRDNKDLKVSGKLPKHLLESGHELRELQKISQHRPEFARAGLDFFIHCSQDEELISTLHSVCLSHALKLSPRLNHKIELASYPQDVVELAQLVL